ncbi:MAG: hypothetical protein DCC46_08220 [Armatimonadetes bacterium]|nr:MAG: hypothetical protein DCC46_08220 [Armatimonadota bacterium]
MNPRIVKLEENLKSGSRPLRTRVDLVVLHATAGSSLSGAIATLRSRGLSYHFLIDKDGTIVEAAPTSRKAFHAGNSYGPKEKSRGVDPRQDAQARFLAKTSVNAYSIGIAFVNRNDGVDPYTPEQKEAIEPLLRLLKDKHRALRYLTTHFAVSPKRKTDPRGFPYESLASRVGLIAWP